MLTSKFSRVGLSYAFAALLVVAAPGVRSSFAAAATSPSIRLLNSKLPQGLTLSKASLPQTATALKAAATERPELAVSLLQAAITSHTINGKFTGDCSGLVKLVQAAAEGAPKKSRELSEAADSLDPECADALDQYLTDAGQPTLGQNGSGRGEGAAGAEGDSGDGAGLGTGFPGSPNFVGSAPGGTLALPPTGVAVSSDTNG